MFLGDDEKTEFYGIDSKAFPGISERRCWPDAKRPAGHRRGHGDHPPDGDLLLFGVARRHSGSTT